MRIVEITQSPYPVVYHGGRAPVKNFVIPPHGAYFTPHLGATTVYGPVVTKARVFADKIYVIDYTHPQDDDILDALFDRDYEKVAEVIAQLKSEGYQAMQTVTDSEMLVVFPGTRIQVL